MTLQRGNLFDGMKVVDLGAGLAGGLLGKLLTDGGAAVTRVEQTGGDPFHALYPAYGRWQAGKTRLFSDDRTVASLAALLDDADVCILGGEDHPDLLPLPDADALAARFPRLVVLDIAAHPFDRTMRAVESLAQIRSGYAYELYSTRPIQFAFPLTAYGAALHGAVALLAALCERESSGRGQRVTTSLLQSGIFWSALFWFEAEKPDRAFAAQIPRDVEQLIFECSDGRFIHFMMGTPGAVAKLYRVIGIDDPSIDPDDRGLPTGRGDPKNFWGDIDRIQAAIIKLPSGPLLEALWAERMAAEIVNAPGECWNDPQVAHNGILRHCADGAREVGFPICTSANPASGRPVDALASGAGSGPLAGLKVLDIGNFVAGPYVSVLLGDLGAEVIKLEALTGDLNRGLFRGFAPANRGKLSISADTRTDDGAELTRRLCAWADVVVHNLRPGASHRLGIDAETLQRAKPSIIVEEISGYGIDGPRADMAGFDMLFQAYCGHERRCSGPDGKPIWNRSAIVDFTTGLLGVVGILGSLWRRQRGLPPPSLFLNLLDTSIFMMAELVEEVGGTFVGADPMNRDLTGVRAGERLYRTTDGWLGLAVRGDAMGRRLGDALGLTGAIGAHVAQWTEADGQAIADALAALDTPAASSLLAAADVWFEIADPDVRDALMADRELQAAGIVLRTQDPRYGDLRQIGTPLQFLRTPLSPDGRGHTPDRGEHNRAVLERLEYDAAEIDRLLAGGIVA